MLRSQEMAFPSLNFEKFSGGGGMPPDPPSFLKSRTWILSDFDLDPPERFINMRISSKQIKFSLGYCLFVLN